MKKVLFILLIAVSIVYACDREEDAKSERYQYLTGTTWTTDSLLANGEDASGPGGLLEDFKGDANFYEDGTLNFGSFSGTWAFNKDETVLTITSPDLPMPSLSVIIDELTATSLKVKTTFPAETGNIDIRMTFLPK